MLKWIGNNVGNLIICYVAIGLISFGVEYNKGYNCGIEPAYGTPNWSENWSDWWQCRHGGPEAAFRGIFWPIVTVGQFAIWITSFKG